MKNPTFLLLAVAVLALGIAGIVFLSTATERVPLHETARTSSLVAGITCLALSTGLLVFGVVMFRKREGDDDRRHPQRPAARHAPNVIPDDSTHG